LLFKKLYCLDANEEIKFSVCNFVNQNENYNFRDALTLDHYDVEDLPAKDKDRVHVNVIIVCCLFF